MKLLRIHDNCLKWVVFLASCYFVPLACSSPSNVRIYLLAGQSNMVGEGCEAHLDLLVQSCPTAYGHLQSSKGNWSQHPKVNIAVYPKLGSFSLTKHLQPLSSVGHGLREEHFGPEVGIGWTLARKYGDTNILLIKVAWGGINLAVDLRPPSSSTNWNGKDSTSIIDKYRIATSQEVGHYYREMVSRTKSILTALPSETYGSNPELSGIFFLQGWDDLEATRMNEYEYNLVNFIRDIRRDLNASNVPFVFGELGQHGNSHIGKKYEDRVDGIRQAQENVAKLYPEFFCNVDLMETSEIVIALQEQNKLCPVPRSCGCYEYHYYNNAEIFYKIGIGMGNTMVSLGDCITQAADGRDLQSKMSGQIGSCKACTDIEVSWMTIQQETCATSPETLERLCKKNEYWSRNRICEFSCFLTGYGYDGEECCTTSPTNAPSQRPSSNPTELLQSYEIFACEICEICDDVEPDWMISQGKECPSSEYLSQKCNKNEDWTNNKFCRLSCHEAGYGYLGDQCCTKPSDAPSMSPTQLPGIDYETSESSCKACTDIEVSWMTIQQERCATSPDTLERLCKKNKHWAKNRICELSCFLAGYGYDGEECCTTNPTPSPKIPSASPTQIPGTNCERCDDVGNGWMIAVGNECPSSYLLEKRCNKSTAWIKNKYCRQSCYEAGYGYFGEECCTVSPTTSPSTASVSPTQLPGTNYQTSDCDICDDVANGWMITVGNECPSSYLLETRCNKSTTWIKEKYCRLSCYEAGYGYVTDKCCSEKNILVPTSMVPSQSPSDKPFYYPSEAPSFQQSSSPTIQSSVNPSRSTHPSLTTTPPSSLPTLYPTIEPTFSPSSSGEPTTLPSNSISPSRSTQPTLLPIELASALPSITPSELPSFTPTIVLSNGPTLFLSKLPSFTPTMILSNEPTLFPSLSPSTQPPSYMPSPEPTVVGCIECTDEGNSWMRDQDIACHPDYILMKTKCNRNQVWRREKPCQYTCYITGSGYDGDVCCIRKEEDL